MRYRNHNEKINEAKRLEILRVYQEQGPAAARKFCLSLGLCGGYYVSLAYSRGVSRPKSKPLTAKQKADMRAVIPADDWNDPRWQWAIDRGGVIAP